MLFGIADNNLKILPYSVISLLFNRKPLIGLGEMGVISEVLLETDISSFGEWPGSATGHEGFLPRPGRLLTPAAQ